MYSKDYFEAYALLVLICYSSEFDNKYFKSESPDWISLTSGIEVTRVTNPFEMKIDSFCIKLLGKEKDEIDESILAKANAQIFFNDEKIIGFSPNIITSANVYMRLSIDAIKKKIEKLNTKYTIKNKNIIFLFEDIGIDCFFVEELRENFVKLQNKYVNKFQELYVFDMETIFYVNLIDGSITEKSVERDKLKYFKSNALKYEKNRELVQNYVFTAKRLEILS